MASAADEIFEANAEAYDELRAELLTVNGTVPSVYLLQKNEETGEYTQLLQLTASHYWKFEELRGQVALKVARRDSTFIAAYNKMSDFSIGGQVYTVDNRDKESPQGSQFYYLMYGVRVEESYVVLIL